MSKTNILSIVINKSGIDYDIIMKLVDDGYFKIIKSLQCVEFINTTPLAIEYIDDKSKYYVEYKNSERSIIFERASRKSHIFDYVYERNPWLGSKLRNQGQRYICPECLKVNVPCHCNTEKKTLSPKARVPRKNASKQKWKEFRNLFNI